MEKGKKMCLYFLKSDKRMKLCIINFEIHRRSLTKENITRQKLCANKVKKFFHTRLTSFPKLLWSEPTGIFWREKINPLTPILKWTFFHIRTEIRLCERQNRPLSLTHSSSFPIQLLQLYFLFIVKK